MSLAKRVKSLFKKRVEEVDLNQESIKAAAFYLKKAGGDGVPLDEQMRMTNYVAHGFFMGFREAEKSMGVE